jgi:GNAT superfamily N-acetyltransferase
MLNPNHVLARSVPTSGELDLIEDRLYEFNCSRVGQDDGQLFAFFIRDEKQEIVAGISGWTWARASEIRQLWVHPDWRGHGYGKMLLDAAEQEARDHGCQVIGLDTYSFQAPGFYSKYGYQKIFQVDDFPPGHQAHFYLKRLDAGDGEKP